MPTSHEKSSEKATTSTSTANTSPAELPRPLRFPLIVVLNLFLSSLLYTLTAAYTTGEFAPISRSLNRWSEAGTLVAWRTFELGLGWFGDYDGYDLAALSVLSHGPPLYLLGAFYGISPITLLSSLVIDTLATYVPFRLLRPLSHAHASSTSTNSIKVLNKEIVTDFTIQILTTILAAGIYGVTLYGAYASFLPVSLVTYFSNIPSIAAAHSAAPITLTPLALAFGLAARSFIFTPATTSSPSLVDSNASVFNPSTATLTETLLYNVWHYSLRTKIIIGRTAALMLVSGTNTFVQVYATIAGVEPWGAAAYSSVWVLAGLLVGASLGLVGAV